MMLKCSVVHYLRNFPWCYYLAGGLLRSEEPVVSLFLSPDVSAALISRRRQHVGFEMEIASLPDAPPLLGPGTPRGTANRSFSTKLLSRYRANGAPQFWFLPDLGLNDLYCNMHSTAKLRETDVESLLESLHEEPRQVIGAWEDSRSFRWCALSPELKLPAGKLKGKIPQIMILGVPGEYCEQIEDWVEAQQGTLLGIVPVQVAFLRWCIQMIPVGRRTIFVMMLLAHSVVLAVIQNQEILLLRQYDEEASLVCREILPLAEELKVTDPEVYVWSPKSVPEDLASRLRGTELAGDALRQISGSPVTYRKGDGSTAETDAQVPHLLNWMSHEFV
ncbi:MAG: hypothetical protein WB586_03920 [Chthoniobacterales bacterium]